MFSKDGSEQIGTLPSGLSSYSFPSLLTHEATGQGASSGR